MANIFLALALWFICQIPLAVLIGRFLKTASQLDRLAERASEVPCEGIETGRPRRRVPLGQKAPPEVVSLLAIRDRVHSAAHAHGWPARFERPRNLSDRSYAMSGRSGIRLQRPEALSWCDCL